MNDRNGRDSQMYLFKFNLWHSPSSPLDISDFFHVQYFTLRFIQINYYKLIQRVDDISRNNSMFVTLSANIYCQNSLSGGCLENSERNTQQRQGPSQNQILVLQLSVGGMEEEPNPRNTQWEHSCHVSNNLTSSSLQTVPPGAFRQEHSSTIKKESNSIWSVWGETEKPISRS